MEFTNMVKGLLASLCIALSTNVGAYTIDDGGTVIDVGGADAYEASTVLANSGYATELDWVNSVLGTTMEITSKTDFADLSSWTATQESFGIVAHALSTSPEYYLLKIGVGDSGNNTHFLFNNADSLDYAVLDLFSLGIDPATVTFNFFALSHLTEFGGSASVPEPGTLLLLGLGLLGLGVTRRRS